MSCHTTVRGRCVCMCHLANNAEVCLQSFGRFLYNAPGEQTTANPSLSLPQPTVRVMAAYPNAIVFRKLSVLNFWRTSVRCSDGCNAAEKYMLAYSAATSCCRQPHPFQCSHFDELDIEQSDGGVDSSSLYHLSLWKRLGSDVEAPWKLAEVACKFKSASWK